MDKGVTPPSVAVMTPMLELLNWIERNYGVSIEQLCGGRRQKAIYKARQVFCFLAYYKLEWSYPQIAEFLNQKDHTSALHAVKTFNPAELPSVVLGWKVTSNNK